MGGNWWQFLLANLPAILAALAGGLAALRPFLIAHGFDAATIDKILELLALFTTGAMRAKLPIDNKGVTYGAVGVGTVALAASSLGFYSTDTALTLGAVALGVTGLGFHWAMRRMDAHRPL